MRRLIGLRLALIERRRERLHRRLHRLSALRIRLERERLERR